MPPQRFHFAFFQLLLLSQFLCVELTIKLCHKKPRPPPGGCCPIEYTHLCCPFAGDNETIVPCANGTSTSTTLSDRTHSGSSVNNVRQQQSLDPRKVCANEWITQACTGGFYLDPISGVVQACPAGFYCPTNLLCIMPCPSGAYCVPTKSQIEKNGECYGFGVCCDKNPPLVLSKSRNCNDSNTTCICGGPDRPSPCPAGFYCPKTDIKKPCDHGYYCRPGSTEPDPCPLLTKCGDRVSAPIVNFIAPLVDFLVLLLFVVIFLIHKNWRIIKFYSNLYIPRILGRQRSLSQTYQVDAGIMHSLNRLNDFAVIQHSVEIEPKSFTIDISFKNLGLSLNSGKNKGKVVLEGVTGHVRSGEVTAVMGPSGAGKTTFLNTLSGKAYYGDTTGKIFFNKEEVKGIKTFRSVTGFVPQDDTMHRHLTVHEVLHYQAVLRLPSGTPRRLIKFNIGQVLDILEISHVADSLIGDEETRGISGGQRKRVNIGMELIADPTLLFLDEPTSGLDSTSSLSVLKSLRTVAEKGKLTILCVIHQPRFEIFDMFHNVLFLGPGGKTVYQGSVSAAKDFFSSLGYEIPPNLNPADYYMDVIGGSVKPSGGFEGKDLFESWKQHHSQNPSDVNEDITPQSSSVEYRILPNPFYQFLNFLQREFLLQLRGVKTLIIDAFLVFIAGGILGALYNEVKLEKVTALTRMSGMAVGLTAILASLRCFGNHRTTFWRESAAGVNRVSYFLAVNFAQIPIMILMPLVYLSLLYTWTSPRSYFRSYYTAVLCVQFCCTGMGYAISTIFNPKSSQMASVVVVLVMAMLSGSSPTLCKLDELTFFGPVAYSISYVRWFVEALFEKEALRYPEVNRPLSDRIAFQDHYTLENNYSSCLGILVLMGVVYRVFALLFLLFTNRGKQK